VGLDPVLVRAGLAEVGIALLAHQLPWPLFSAQVLTAALCLLSKASIPAFHTVLVLVPALLPRPLAVHGYHRPVLVAICVEAHELLSYVVEEVTMVVYHREAARLEDAIFFMVAGLGRPLP
jgi:hypothetical protein